MAEIICIDFHGVLTDGKLNVSHDGKTFFESCHTRDVRAIRELVASGHEVYIVTASMNPIVQAFAEKVGVVVIQARDKSEMPAIFKKSYIAIGDDAWDVPMLEKAVHAFCPADADPCVKSLPHIRILNSKGGQGVIAELVPLLALSTKIRKTTRKQRYSQ